MIYTLDLLSSTEIFDETSFSLSLALQLTAYKSIFETKHANIGLMGDQRTTYVLFVF